MADEHKPMGDEYFEVNGEEPLGDAPPYAGLAMFSTFAPILVLVASIIGRKLLAGNEAGRMIFAVIATLALGVGLACGLRALGQAKRQGNAKYLLRSVAGVFANGMLLLFMAVTLISGYANPE